MKKVLVIGGGPSGMMAAAAAAKAGADVSLLEKNEKLGKKLFITGKGRCNVTNCAEQDELFANICSNEKFFYSAFHKFDNRDIMNFLEEAGCPLKVERGGRVFPVSDHSSDVIGALQRELKRLGVKICLRTEVKELIRGKLNQESGQETNEETSREETQKEMTHEIKAGIKEEIMDTVSGVLLSDGRKLWADAVIICTGGLSYSSTGSTGDGYRFALKTGHRIAECRPSLVPFETEENWCTDLAGLSLRNVSVYLVSGKKELYRGFGEMLFTHFGVSGPLVLSASSFYTGQEKQKVMLFIDLKPALNEEQLDKRILRDFEEQKNKRFKNALGGLFPAGLIPVMIALSGIDPEKQVNEVTREERRKFVSLMKKLPVTIAGTRSYAEAIITKGGVSVRDVNPSTMESKRIRHLYFAGEVLDLDAMTGGFNLQIAWSTGYLAGECAGTDAT